MASLTRRVSVSAAPELNVLEISEHKILILFYQTYKIYIQLTLPQLESEHKMSEEIHKC